MLDYDYPDQIPVLSRLVGGPRDGETGMVESVNRMVFGEIEGSLVWRRVYDRVSERDADGALRYVYDEEASCAPVGVALRA